MKDIEIIEIDYSGKKVEYKKEDNVELAKISAPWIVPEEGPFYSDSLRVLKGGLDLAPGADFTLSTPVTDLTKLTGKSVHLYIKLKDHVLTSGGTVDVIYQKVGNPIISVKKLMDMLEEMVIEGKPVDWDTQIVGKPDTYYPAWHSHDIQNPDEMVGFGGLIELFQRAQWDVETNGPRVVQLLKQLEKECYDRLNYVQKLHWGKIMNHVQHYNNPHELKPDHVDLGNVPNFATATPEEDAAGEREDLFSTPAGLSRIIEAVEPESEEFLFQNELPFSYYGSGIYLPPPITGSFEGLGGDVENSAFCLEGNGWLVSLYRAYDGRVKNLYYAYNANFRRPQPLHTDWVVTYVQYQHPTISAVKDKNGNPRSPNYVISGSSGDVLMIGDQQVNDVGAAHEDSLWWVCAANNTFDPASHNLKPIDVKSAIAQMPTVGGTQPGRMTISHVGRWVYVLINHDGYESDDPGRYNAETQNGVGNWATFMFRFEYSDLLNPAVSTITLTHVPVTYQDFYREMRAGKASFIPQKHVWNAEGKITQFVVNYDRPVETVYLNRKKTFIIVPNKDDPSKARIRLVMDLYNTATSGGGMRGFGMPICADYEWDVENNILMLNPHWDMGTFKVDYQEWAGNRPDGWVNPTQNFLDYCMGYFMSKFTSNFANTSGSWVPGYGYIAMGSWMGGTPPFVMLAWVANFTGDPNRDFYSVHDRIQQRGPGSALNDVNAELRMNSPFGVTGFPRYFTDIYDMTDGMRGSPIEIFTGENPTQGQNMFYRIAEPGEGLGYVERPQLQSRYLGRKVVGRSTNSAFGMVRGLTPVQGYTNRPNRPGPKSRETGTFGYGQRGLAHPAGQAHKWFTYRTGYDSQREFVRGEFGTDDAIINLSLDYSLDTVSNTLTVKGNPNKNLRVPYSVYHDMVMGALGSRINDVLDLIVGFTIGGQPGVGGDNVPSFFCLSYHLKQDPSNTRTVVGKFWWEVAGTHPDDGIRIMRVVDLSYPFTSVNHGGPMVPDGDNVSYMLDHALLPDGTWPGYGWREGLTISQTHVEVYDHDPENAPAGNYDIVYYPGYTLGTIGNANQPVITYFVRGGVVIESKMTWLAVQAFNEFFNAFIAVPGVGIMQGVPASASGGAMCLTQEWAGIYADRPVNYDYYVMQGATYVEGNWTVFVNAEVKTTFNGYTMTTKMINWDLRDSADDYRNTTFYIYCCAMGSGAEYELTKQLKTHNSNAILVGIIKTDLLGIKSIERRQGFSISGFPLTRSRDMGIPVSSGAVTESGTYKFIRRDELYQG